MALNRDKIVAEYLRGVTVIQLARKHGVSRERIYQILRKEPLFEIWKKKHYCAKRKKVIEKFYQSKTYSEFAERLGTSLANALLVLRRLVARGCLDEKELERFRENRRKKTLAYKIIQLKRGGVRNRDIAEKLGCSVYYVGTVIWRARKMGILPKAKIIEFGK